MNKRKVVLVKNLKNEFKNDLIVKSNDLIEAPHRLSVQEQRIVLILISLIKKEDKAFEIYRFKIDDFLKIVGVKSSGSYTRLKKITKNLRKKELIVKKKDGGELQTGWLVNAEYIPKEGCIELMLDPKLMPYLLDLKEQFTGYYLKYVLKLTSSYAIRLYELLKQYKSIGHRYFDISYLKEKMEIKENQYKAYGDFKKKVIIPSHKQINEKTDIRIEYKEEKEKGTKKVSGIKFFITQNSKNILKTAIKKDTTSLPQPEINQPTTTEHVTQTKDSVITRLQQLGFTDAKTIRKKHSDEFWNHAFADLDFNIKIEKNKIDSPGAWLRNRIKEMGENYIHSPLFKKHLDEQKAQEVKVLKDKIQKQIEYNKDLLNKKWFALKEQTIELQKQILDDEWEIIKEDIKKEVSKDKTKVKFGFDMHLRIAEEGYLLEKGGLPKQENWLEKEINRLKLDDLVKKNLLAMVGQEWSSLNIEVNFM